MSFSCHLDYLSGVHMHNLIKSKKGKLYFWPFKRMSKMRERERGRDSYHVWGKFIKFHFLLMIQALLLKIIVNKCDCSVQYTLHMQTKRDKRLLKLKMVQVNFEFVPTICLYLSTKINLPIDLTKPMRLTHHVSLNFIRQKSNNSNWVPFLFLFYSHCCT